MLVKGECPNSTSNTVARNSCKNLLVTSLNSNDKRKTFCAIPNTDEETHEIEITRSSSTRNLLTRNFQRPQVKNPPRSNQATNISKLSNVPKQASVSSKANNGHLDGSRNIQQGSMLYHHKSQSQNMLTKTTNHVLETIEEGDTKKVHQKSVNDGLDSDAKTETLRTMSTSKGKEDINGLSEKFAACSINHFDKDKPALEANGNEQFDSSVEDISSNLSKLNLEAQKEESSEQKPVIVTRGPTRRMQSSRQDTPYSRLASSLPVYQNIPVNQNTIEPNIRSCSLPLDFINYRPNRDRNLYKKLSGGGIVSGPEETPQSDFGGISGSPAYTLFVDQERPSSSGSSISSHSGESDNLIFGNLSPGYSSSSSGSKNSSPVRRQTYEPIMNINLEYDSGAVQLPNPEIENVFHRFTQNYFSENQSPVGYQPQGQLQNSQIFTQNNVLEFSQTFMDGNVICPPATTPDVQTLNTETFEFVKKGIELVDDTFNSFSPPTSSDSTLKAVSGENCFAYPGDNQTQSGQEDPIQSSAVSAAKQQRLPSFDKAFPKPVPESPMNQTGTLRELSDDDLSILMDQLYQPSSSSPFSLPPTTASMSSFDQSDAIQYGMPSNQTFVDGTHISSPLMDQNKSTSQVPFTKNSPFTRPGLDTLYVNADYQNTEVKYISGDCWSTPEQNNLVLNQLCSGSEVQGTLQTSPVRSETTMDSPLGSESSGYTDTTYISNTPSATSPSVGESSPGTPMSSLSNSPPSVFQESVMTNQIEGSVSIVTNCPGNATAPKFQPSPQILTYAVAIVPTQTAEKRVSPNRCRELRPKPVGSTPSTSSASASLSVNSRAALPASFPARCRRPSRNSYYTALNEKLGNDRRVYKTLQSAAHDPALLEINSQGDTRLHEAFRNKNPHHAVDILRIWKQHFRSKRNNAGFVEMVNRKNINGETPLHLSIIYMANAYPEFAGALLEAGADIRKTDNLNNTVFHYAVRACSGALNMIKLLKEFLNDDHVELENFLKTKNNEGSTPLHLAVIEGKESYQEKLNLIEYLLHQKAPLAIQDNAGKTPLSKAIELKDQELIKCLLDSSDESEKDLALKIQDQHGYTVLHGVATMNQSNPATQIELATILITRGADPSIKNKFGQQPHDLVDRSRTDVIRRLQEMWEPELKKWI